MTLTSSRLRFSISKLTIEIEIGEKGGRGETYRAPTRTRIPSMMTLNPRSTSCKATSTSIRNKWSEGIEPNGAPLSGASASAMLCGTR